MRNIMTALRKVLQVGRGHGGLQGLASDLRADLAAAAAAVRQLHRVYAKGHGGCIRKHCCKRSAFFAGGDAPSSGGRQHRPEATVIRSVADILEVVLMRFWRACLLGMAVCAGVAYLLLSPADMYEARSLLLYQLGRDYIYIPDASGSGIRAPDPGALQLYVNAEIQILDSTPLRLALLEKLGVEKIYPDLAAEPDAVRLAEKALQSDISIKLIAGSYIVDVRVRHSERDRAAEIAEALVATYMEQRTKVLGAESPAFVQDEIALAMARLREIENGVRAELDGHDVAYWDAAQEAALSARAITNQTLASLRAEISALTETERLASAEIEALAPEARVAGNPIFDRAAGALRGARLGLAQSRARQLSLNADMATNEAILSERAAIAGQIEQARDRLAAERENLDRLQARLRDSELALARSKAGAGSVRVIEAATVAENPVGAPKMIRAIGAALVGMFAAVIFILAAYMRRPTVLTANMLQSRLGIPIVGEIEDRASPRMRRYVRREQQRQDRDRKKSRSDPARPGVALRPAVRQDELFGAVQTLIGLWQRHQRTLIVHVVGPSGGEGVSSVAVALAEIVGNVRPTGILLITLDDAEAAPVSTGFRQIVDHMAEEAGHHIAAIDGGIGVIRTHLSSTELRGGIAYELRDGLQGMPQEIGLVIIDTKALLSNIESAAICGQVDGVFLVVSAKHTTSEDLRRAAETLKGAGGQILGAILNRRRYRLPATISNFLGISVPAVPRATRRGAEVSVAPVAAPVLPAASSGAATPPAEKRNTSRSRKQSAQAAATVPS